MNESEIRAEFEVLVKCLTEEQLDNLILLAKKFLQCSEAESDCQEKAD